MRLRDRLGISERNQERATRFMQVALIVMAASGFYSGDFKVIINASIAALITFAPALLEKRYDIALDPALSLWISSAVFFHALGTTTVIGQGFYGTIPWWDQFTHALSASVVSAAGYISLRVLDEHSEELYFPKKLMFVFILIFVLAFGVIWELLEFGISGAAEMLGGKTILTQYGLEDTMKDLMFNTAGGIIVALFGEVYLSNSVEVLRQRMDI